MGITDKNSILQFESGILMTKQKMYEARHIGISVWIFLLFSFKIKKKLEN